MRLYFFNEGDVFFFGFILTGFDCFLNNDARRLAFEPQLFECIQNGRMLQLLQN